MGQKIESATIKLPEYGGEVNYGHTGSGDCKWVLVHGLGSYSKAYTKMMESLPENIEAFAIDLPGFGDSELGDFEPSMEGYSSVVNEFVEQLGLQDVVLLGHSMGGQIAMKLAMNNPQWLSNLILFAPAGIEQFSDTDKGWFGQVVTEELYLNLTDEQIRQNFNVNFYGFQMPEDAAFMYEDRMKIKEDATKYQKYCATIVACINAMLQEPVYDDLGKIEVPVLVLYGKGDSLIPNKMLHGSLSIEQMLDSLQKNHPKINTKIVDDAGHFIIWDQTIVVLDEIKKFIETKK